MAYDDRALRGVGGWLAFFVLTLAVFGPLRGALQAYGLLALPTPPAFADGWPTVRALTVAEFLINAAIGWYLAWRLVYRQEPATPRIVIAGLWAVALIVMPAMVGLVSLLGAMPLSAMLPGSSMAILQGVIYALVWTLYLRRSRRVANTYTDEEGGELHAVFE